MIKHPSKALIGSKTNLLKGKRIIIGICGSVAAIKSPEIARELMRYGAEVWTVMTESSQKIIHPYVMEWATGNPVVTELTGKIEHVSLIGEEGEMADLLLIAPATANTISKIANGIDDTPVTSVATVAIGSKVPVVIVPAMHDAMYKNPLVKKNIEKLKEQGITFVDPVIEEGKAKIAPIENIILIALHKTISKKDFKNKKILITAGPTREHIDPIRFISNPSSGKMGISLAIIGYLRGADVHIIYGPGTEKPPSLLKVTKVFSAEDMQKAVFDELKKNDFDIFISAAAISDFYPKNPVDYKISSDLKKYVVELHPTPKLISNIKRKYPDLFVVGFKAEYKVSDNELIDRAYAKLLESNIDLIIANDVGRPNVGFGSDITEVIIIDKQKNIKKFKNLSKIEIAEKIFDTIHFLLS